MLTETQRETQAADDLDRISNDLAAMQFGTTLDTLAVAVDAIGAAMDAIVDVLVAVCKVITAFINDIKQLIVKYLHGDEKYRKWWHYCNHGKRRTRKKYQRKIIKELFK